MAAVESNKKLVFKNRQSWRRHAFGFLSGGIILSLTASSALASPGLKTLRRHLPESARHLAPSGRLAPEKHLTLALGLPLGNAPALDDFLQQVYDPNSPLFHNFITPQEFAQRFGPTEAQYQQLAAFARSNHLAIVGRHANRLVLDVDGSVTDIERAFKLKLLTYPHPTESRDFYAPDVDPAVDAQLPLLDVSGLNNYILPHPQSVRLNEMDAAANVARSGSSPSGAYQGNDFRAAYLPGVKLTGAGQVLGLVQFDGFYSNDIAAYETAAGLPHVPLQTILLDGYNGTPTSGSKSGNPEVSLDIEMAISMAPGLAKVVVFEAGPNGLENDILSAMASHSEIKQLSCSWGWGGGPSATTDNLFKQMAAQGQSFFSASGDSDAFPAGTVDDPSQANAPSSCPYITVVGGTTLTTSGPGGAWSSEAVWNRGGGVGSSGGVSSYYGLPGWQSGVSLSGAGGSTAHRNTPDVAMTAENIHVAYGNGTNGTFGGTSCAAPLWAGLAALMNEQASQIGKSPVGFVNPALYALGRNAGAYAQAFHDIASGDNTWSSSPNAFYAGPGYDLCTGWGTPAGQALIDAVAGPRDSLTVVPVAGVLFTGPVGGPLNPLSGQFTLSNAGPASVGWSLVNTSAWLKVDAVSGSIPPAGASTLNVSLDSSAAQLPEGSYIANLLISNSVSHVIHTASCKLLLGQSIVQNGGFETGDFSDWTLAGRTILNSPNSGPTVYNAVESNNSGYQVAHSGNFGIFLGDTQLALLSQDLPTVPGQAYVLSFWLNNPTSGSGQHFQVQWNTSGTAPNLVYSLTNPPSFGWTNLQFIVTAGVANTTLQFGAENDPAGFGLDDVSLKPLPALGFESLQLGPTGCQLSWRSTSGVLYQVQSTTDLSQGTWDNIGAQVTGNGGLVSITDNGASTAEHKFYRLSISP